MVETKLTLFMIENYKFQTVHHRGSVRIITIQTITFPFTDF
jgi:hypothetical protein